MIVYNKITVTQDCDTIGHRKNVRQCDAAFNLSRVVAHEINKTHTQTN